MVPYVMCKKKMAVQIHKFSQTVTIFMFDVFCVSFCFFKLFFSKTKSQGIIMMYKQDIEQSILIRK